MKKFMKVAAITGSIFFLIGLIVMIIGIGCGGIKDMREKSMAEVQRVMDKFEGIEIIDGISITFEGTDIFDDNKYHEIIDGEVNKVHKISIMYDDLRKKKVMEHIDYYEKKHRVELK